MDIDYSLISDDYKDSAYLYCCMALDGRIIVGNSVFQACIRHLNDLIRIKDDNFLYTYIPAKAQNIIDFIEILPDVKTGEPYPLAFFQKFILASLYGWRKKTDQSLRRFKKAFISMARKSGKTILVAGILLYEFLFGKNPAMSRQIFCTANDKKQAGIAFEMARKQLDALRAKDEDIRKATKRVREVLKNLADESYITVLSRDTGAIDGFEPYIGLLDEYAASKTDEMMELLESGQGQLENALILIISTAGLDLNVPMHTIEYPRAKKILKNEIEDDEYFAFIAEHDDEKEVDKEETWIKSNPILEVEAIREKIMIYLRKRRKVSLETGAVTKVLVKNFNMWRQSSEQSYMDNATWQKALIEEKPDISKRRAWIGVDVGRSSDLFAISWLTMAEEHWDVDSFSFVATKYGLRTKEKRDGQNYSDLALLGECEITQLESGVIDDERVFEWLENFIIENELEVQGIFYDPYQFGTLLTYIEKRHPEWKIGEIPQTTMILNMPTKQFRDDVRNGKIKHSGNQLLTAAVNNAFTREDNNGMRIDKNKNSNKIDPIDALLDAYAACYLEPFDGSSYWTNEKILSDDFGF
ncbi:terminase large subunit [Carnobacterium maltaromaticum]|uniref:terminase large subunit n=1 Tax=Carnobacterium maltaromaticum TaxID=2751 RepID=UPI0012FB83A8|nr:terminase TerL endonuclease subunit [Carnobacterium maltaromaticum]